MSEQNDLSSDTKVSNTITDALEELLMDQVVQPVTCLPMHKNQLPFARDLKNPGAMSRVTYNCLTALLVDNTTRALMGFPLLDIGSAMRDEIKRVMREAPYKYITGVGVRRRFNPNDIGPGEPKRKSQPVATQDSATSRAPKHIKSKPNHAGIDSTTYEIIGHIHRQMRYHPEELPHLPTHENGLRNPDQMTPETAAFLKVLHGELKKNPNHSLRTEFVKGSIAEVLSQYETSNENNTVDAVDVSGQPPTLNEVEEISAQENHAETEG